VVALIMWFNGWVPVARVVLFSAIAYLTLLTLIRVTGKRTIAKMNPGDFAIIVAIGSVAASTIVDTAVSLVEGVAAVGALIALQFGSEWLTSRSSWIRRVADGQPVLLAYRGTLLQDAMQREHIHEEDILAVARQHGIGRLSDLHAVVLEVDGSLSVVPSWHAGDDTLKDVDRKTA
jgi:uncharacterized membrane protein YcaP (DUF421 family)